MQEELFSVQYAILPETVEDRFALRQNGRSALLCVTDGCGGLGSRRYPALGNRTGAGLAAELAADAVEKWWQGIDHLPITREAGEDFRRKLAEKLYEALTGFAMAHPQTGSRIVGSMQRELPTTLCAALSAPEKEGRRQVCFLWAGDSRGYVLNRQGLHQCTRDHLRGGADPLLSLYRDVPLGNLICAGRMPRLSMRRLTVQEPCFVLTATDGVFGGLRTPMEMEMLLIDTLLAAKTQEGWKRKLNTLLKKTSGDDATLLCQACGFEDFAAMQQLMAPRRAELQKQFITPVRRNRTQMDFVEKRWQDYRAGYDWMEGRQDEDWSL